MNTGAELKGRGLDVYSLQSHLSHPSAVRSVVFVNLPLPVRFNLQ